jgi:hypothetical protein
VLLERGLDEEPDVQRLMADIEASRGEYQSAIVRLERLVQRYPDRGYEVRLAEVKLDYMRANLPPRYHVAVRSSAITRADLAVLAYWHVSAVRFARVNAPPIAVDIAGSPGRDEIVRALGLGFISVDPATRSVDPGRTVSGAAFLTAAIRVLRLGAVPKCAAGLIGAEALVRCGVPVGRMVAAPTDSVSGVEAITALDAIDNLIELPK